MNEVFQGIDHSDNVQMPSSCKFFQYREILDFQQFYSIQYNPLDRTSTQQQVDVIIHEKVGELMTQCIQTFEEARKKHPRVKLDFN